MVARHSLYLRGEQLADEELNELRAMARARHRATTRKISRIKNDTGLPISGSRNDPRRDLSKVKRYTKSQLRTYIAQLNDFSSRSVQFVPSANRTPIQADLWKKYKSLEGRYNRRVNAQFEKVADVFLPAVGQTLGERMAMITPAHRQLTNPAVNSPYRPAEMKPSNVASEQALIRLIAQKENQLKASYRKKLIDDARSQFAKMADVINRRDLAQDVSKLSDAQFEVLWNYTPFATAIGINYEVIQAMLSNNEKPYHSDSLRNAVASQKSLIEWARKADIPS